MSSTPLPAAVRDRVRFDADGLVPAIAQDVATGEVLMMAWMNDAALATTLSTRQGTYWSRSRGELWRKGASSGHTQQVVGVALDCDGDTVLLRVEQTGPACHTGTTSCFTDRAVDLDALETADAAEAARTGEEGRIDGDA
ncbi:phosphoribosyl-AMP cyclohydrolase [Nesterenkonia sp. F]|uniref:phosphoribosyl-AMP cyclohydrolase n=1 Tax=Nesterenkonia sp. F TaxID=795955 RepID=UPI000255CD47|nr:phosphoribosyl-AMP cyclohydrolase [Nesterenkonia sp. F]